ncbi:50S ribosomal protein L25/general stress protein Ctc [Polyangium aurulentum]|nr:50S ribosomal protein L25/general stress protein Ctc [Polyangium aurulentum]
MEISKLSATPRQESGKGPSNRLRRTGQIPAICYGKELAATQVAVSPKALLEVLKTPHGKNAVIELAIEGGDKLTVMVRDYDYHPISRELTHADFVQVKLDQPVDVQIPLRTTGKSKGVAAGGIVQQVFRNIPVRCLPERIPALIEVDVTELDVGEGLHANQLPLPEGVRVLLPEGQTVVVVAAPDKGEEAAAAAPGAPAAAGAAAAPAKGAAAAPAKGGAAAAPAKGAAPAKAAAPAKDKKK